MPPASTPDHSAAVTTSTRREAPGVLIPGMTLGELMIVMCSLLLGTLLAALDLSIVATSLPTIAGKLNGFSGYAWVSTAYILASTIAMPIMGKLSDLYGRQKMFHINILIFLVASVLCALSQNMGHLIAARTLQGIGGGGIQAITFAILGDLIAPRERGRYIGIYVAAHTLAAISGPLVGGFIVDRFAWQWVFLINLPLGVVAIAASMLKLRLPFQRRSVRLDFKGALLLSLALGCVMFGLEEGRKAWGRPHVGGLFAACAVLTALFIAQERRAEEPIIPLALFRNGIASNIFMQSVLIGSIAFGAGNVFLPLFFQDARGVSPTRSGLYLIPMMLGSLIGTTVVGRLIARTGRYRMVPIVCAVFSALGIAFIARINPTLPYSQLIIPLFGMGFGTGSIFTTSSVALQNSVERRDLGVATATMTFFRSLGGSIGLALFGTLFSATVATEVNRRLTSPTKVSKLIRDPKAIAALDAPTKRAVVEGLALGIRAVYLVMIPVVAVLFVIALFLREIPLASAASLTPATSGAEPEVAPVPA